MGVAEFLTWYRATLAGSWGTCSLLLTLGLLTSGFYHLPRFLIPLHCPCAVSGGSRHGQKPRLGLSPLPVHPAQHRPQPLVCSGAEG